MLNALKTSAPLMTPQPHLVLLYQESSQLNFTKCGIMQAYLAGAKLEDVLEY